VKKVLINGAHARYLINLRRDLMAAMQAQGWNVVACTADYDDKVHQTLDEMGIQYITAKCARTGANPVMDIGYLFRLYFILKAHKPDIIINYNHKPVVFGSIAAFLSRKTKSIAMITGLGYVFTPGRERRRRVLLVIMKVLYKFVLRLNAHVIFQNEDDRELFQQWGFLGKSVKNSVIMGSGVDTSICESCPACVRPIVFLMSARLIYDKGVREYVDACKIIKSKYANIKFQLLGQMETGHPNAVKIEELDRFVNEVGIEYLGSVETSGEVYTYIKQCSVFVLPSFYREGCPRTILEAMCASKPIITTDNVGCRQTVCDGSNGFLVKKQDSRDLAKAMEYFINNPQQIKPMGVASRKKVEAEFDGAIVNGKIVTIVEGVLN